MNTQPNPHQPTARARMPALLAALICLGALAPASASAQQIPLDAFATLGAFDQLSLSPEGTHLAYLYPYKGQRVVILHPTQDASAPVALPLPTDGFVRWFRWANEKRLLVSYAFTDSQGRELTRLYSYDRKGGSKVRPVPMECVKEIGSKLAKNCIEPRVQDRVIDWLPDDPKHVLIAVNKLQWGGPQVWKANVFSGATRMVRSQADYVSTWITDQGHEVRLGLGRRYDAEGGTPLVGVYQRPDGEWVDVSDTDWMKREIIPRHFEEDPRYAIAVGDVGDTQAVLRLDLVGDEVLEVLHQHPEYDLSPVFHDEEMIGYSIPAQNSRLILTHPEWISLSKKIHKALPNTPLQFIEWSDDRKLIIVRTQSDRDGGTYYVWDRNATKVYPLGSRYPDLPGERMSPMEELVYEASDGLSITAYLTVPRNAERHALPTVVMPHGGPWARDTKHFDYLVQMLASRGYAVFQPNFRGSVYQGREFREAGEGEWGRKMQQDLSDGLAHLIDEGISDPGRVCIVGWSYGGYAALMGAIQEPDRYRCAASINGLTDLKRLRAEYSWSRRGRRYIEAQVGMNNENIESLSPIARAEDISVPVLLVHAVDDGRVDVEHSRLLAKRLKRASAPYEYVEVERGDHSLMHEPSRVRMLQALESFLAQHMGAGLRVGN